MSLFKEKDDYLTRALKDQFQSDTSDEENEDDTLKESASEKEDHNEGLEEQEQLDSGRTIKRPKTEDCEYISLSNDDASNTSDDCCIVLDGNDITKSSLSDVDGPSDNSKIITLDDEHACESDTQSRPRTRRQCKAALQSESRKPAFLNESTHSINENPTPVNMSQDDFEFKLKLIISGTYRQFQTTYKTPLHESLREVIDELRAANKKLIITSETSSIDLDATPSSLKLTPGSILKAIEVASNLGTSRLSPQTTLDPNEITVKLQDGNRRHMKEFRTNIHEPLVKLKQAYARDLKIESLESIKLFFDGDPVDDEMTPEDLDMEDENVIDVIIAC